MCWSVEIRLQLSWSFILCVTTKPFFPPQEPRVLLPWEPSLSSAESAWFCLGCCNSWVFFFCVVPLQPISNHWAGFQASEIQTEGSLFSTSQMSEVDTVLLLGAAGCCGISQPCCSLWHMHLNSVDEEMSLFFFFWKQFALLKRKPKELNISSQHTGPCPAHRACTSSHLLSLWTFYCSSLNTWWSFFLGFFPSRYTSKPTSQPTWKWK